MRFLPLDDIKAHLRLSNAGSLEDALIALYADAACDYVRTFTGEDWQEAGDPMPPPGVKAAALLLVADLYENREAQSPVALSENETVARLLWPHRVF